MEIIHKEIGNRIRLKRKELKVTVKQICHLINCARSTYCNLELGKRRFNIDDLYLISDFLGCTIHDFLPKTNKLKKKIIQVEEYFYE